MVDMISLKWCSKPETVGELISTQLEDLSLCDVVFLCEDGRVNWNINSGPGYPVLMALKLNKVEMFRALVRTPGVDTSITDGEGRSLVQLVM